MATVFVKLTFLLIVFELTAANDCNLSNKQMKKMVKKYKKKCLNLGFTSNLGCASSSELKLKKKGKKKCSAMERKLESCNYECKVDGGYSAFGDWSKCSAECDGGTQTKTRQCNDPAPSNGGKECEGDDSETQTCNEDPCPVDGGYSAFGDWSKCSAECDGGTQTKTRQCNDPAPSNGGKECEGDDSETQTCNEDPCPGENVVYTIMYTIIQQASTGQSHGGTTSGGYLFTLIGSEGETGPHDCSADRSEGSQSQCSFEDDTNIGQLFRVDIENTSANTWVFVNMAVEVDGVVAGRWHGSMTVGDYGGTRTKTISLNTNIVYTIIQQTGTGQYDGGNPSGYLFTLIGTEGETSPHDCSADRSQGSQSQCSFEEFKNIGILKTVKIKNTTANTWVFVNMTVKADGVVAGRIWYRRTTVGDYLTKTISF
ncbi:A disintegrin and metalloproteinase with thrombospondin motifs 8-like [Bolinopsis microptera]|uniref:A disintegrin and metalloproteinase with thrombospondin motifs 8-like n=1 Tax=Bolinopsis microptera TaxID=2820187 RepID=UPI00307AE411